MLVLAGKLPAFFKHPVTACQMRGVYVFYMGVRGMLDAGCWILDAG